MASRRPSNGRSPLVNQQRQITAFFAKKTSSTPSPSPSPSSLPTKQTQTFKNTSPNPNPSPATAPPLGSKSNKPLLVIGPSPTPDSTETSYGQEVLNKRIKVYWPLDKCWYEGCVKSFDKISGKHLVQYDDEEEEMLNLSQERIEWIETPVVTKFRRLRRLKVVDDEEEEELDGGIESGGDDSEDEDWGNNANEEAEEDEGCPADMDLEAEDDDNGLRRGKSGISKKAELRKRKFTEGLKLVSTEAKKIKSGGNNKSTQTKAHTAIAGVKVIESVTNNLECVKASNADDILTGNSAERFSMRETEKLRFLGKGRRDANRRRPGDVNYDSRTLYLPPDFLKGLSGGQRQWWEFKSKHMDKVLFFKMGKFYELFEMDAHIGAKELDLQYMKGEQPHCGFPEKNFSMNAEKLARKGYRVLVIEQTETPEQLELRRREKGSKDKVVKREICAVITKGTLTEGEMLTVSPDASYLIAVTESCQTSANQLGERTYGVCVVDVATSKVILGQFADDSDCSSLCSLLYEFRPVEIIKPAKLLSHETERVLHRHTRNPLVNELVPLSEFWDAEKTISEVKNMYKRLNNTPIPYSQNEADLHPSESIDNDAQLRNLPNVLSELVNAGENGMYALSALGGTLFYLKQAFLDVSLLKFAEFELLPFSRFGMIAQKPYMVLDAAALENLEIFENTKNCGSSGTLYAQMNHCVTAFGKRLLRTWLARPLYHLEAIKERQDAVAGLKGVNLPGVLEFRKELSRLPDMERVLAQIFASSEANGRNANKVVLYEDAAKKQLQQFISALRGCEIMVNACFSLGATLDNTDSKLLHDLLTPGKGLPDVKLVIKQFKDAFDWVEANSSGRIIPCEGVDEEYDAACGSLRKVELSLAKHLKEQQKLFGDTSIKYVTVGKDAYLLEVSESLCECVPQEYELQSSKKGYFRYWNPVIRKLMGELSQAETEKESKLKSILQRLIGRFCEHHSIWRELISTIAELDVLISLSIASDYYEGPTCRPHIRELPSQDNLPCLVAKSLGHPILRTDSLDKGAFVSNDVTLGGAGHSSFILLTGPNMGGKSTLLRQVCLAVILAQVGADVPAASFDLSPVDRIFVRMGAKDHIMAGQSTFLTELLETASMLSSATRNSLVALDELGRGTSTSDGQAIAESVLEHFVHKVQCRGMFSTHYHRLAIDYQQDPQVSLCHMACHVGEGLGGLEEVTFLYKLTLGACPRSYGVNVARLAGLPDNLLEKAAAKSREFEGVYGNNNKGSRGNSSKNWDEKAIEVIRSLMHVADYNKPYGSKAIELLNDLQCIAKVLLE
nr:DNA mismatch repair protein MSH6 [Ipomoea batatas]